MAVWPFLLENILEELQNKGHSTVLCTIVCIRVIIALASSIGDIFEIDKQFLILIGIEILTITWENLGLIKEPKWHQNVFSNPVSELKKKKGVSFLY